MADPALDIRPATAPEDLALARVLFREYAAGLSVDLAYQGFEAELAALPGAYAPPGGTILIARDASGDVLGCGALRPLAPPDVAEMKRLYLRPAARGRGAGRALVAVLAEAARAAGYVEIRLDTLPDMAAAIGLYRAAGFVEIAPYYPTPVAGTRFLALRLADRGPGG